MFFAYIIYKIYTNYTNQLGINKKVITVNMYLVTISFSLFEA